MTAPKAGFICLRYPLTNEGLTIAEAARDLHKRELNSEREFPELPLRRNWFLAVATSRTDVVGYLSAEILEVYEGQWYLNWIVVSQSYRDQGIGTKLLGVAATQAERSDSPLLMLSPLPHEREILFDYYRSRGFRWVKRPNTTPTEFFEATPQDVIKRCGRIACGSADETTTAGHTACNDSRR